MTMTDRRPMQETRPNEGTTAEPARAETDNDNPGVPLADSILFQTAPPPVRPSMFKLKSWTDCVAGYIYEANKLSNCLLRNERLMDHTYQWHLTINLRADLPLKEIKSRWSKACKKLNKSGVVALWVIEVSHTNRVHFHLIVASLISKAALDKAVEEALPRRASVDWHHRTQRIKEGETWQLAHYVCKARVAGYINNRLVEDYYANKRVLFKPKLGLRKHGAIGKFWVKPKAAIWKDITANEEKIAEGLAKPGIRQLVDHVHNLLDRTVSLRRLERSYGLDADATCIRQWAEKLLAGDDGGFESISA